MLTMILDFIGSYTPVSYVDLASGAEIVASGAAGVDWPWIFSAALFLLAFWSFFRLVGVLLSKL